MGTDNHDSGYDKLISQLTHFISLFNSNAGSQAYFKGYIEKFEIIKKKLQYQKIDIGLMGITSSGKSTLLNALLGDDLLPQKVKPSSGVQVLTQYGQKKKAIIYFKPESGRQPESIYSQIRSQLEMFGCETKNKNNELQVDEIHLSSPDYQPNHRTVIIDTPGLDAYDLENHEKITMQMVLPTVQMVIFMTTVKASSDKKNLELIDEIMSENKPLLVVQNMIDSVVEKESSRGIEKTRTDVKEEHLKRINHLLKKAEKNSVRCAPVIQMSALKAKEDAKKWGMEQFIATLQEVIRQTEPERRHLFEQQILKELFKIIDDLNVENQNHGHYRKKQIRLIKLKENIQGCEHYFKDRIAELDGSKRQLIIEIDKLISEIDKTYAGDRNPLKVCFEYDAGISRSSLQMDRITSRLSDVITDLQLKIKSLCDDLNLQNNDVIRRQRIDHFYSRIDIPWESKKTIKTRSEEEKGLLGSIKRFFSGGKYGYKKVEYTVYENIVDIQKLLDNFHRRLVSWSAFIENSLTLLSANTEYSLSIMKQEMLCREKDAKRVINKSIDPEVSKTILAEIEAFSKMMSPGRKNAVFKHFASVESTNLEHMREQTCSKIAVDLFRLAHYESFKPHYAMRDLILKKFGKDQNISILGWDAYHLNRFVDYFFSDNIEIANGIGDDVSTVCYKIKKQSVKTMRIINISNSKGGREVIPTDKTIFFVLLNSNQIGHCEKNLQNSFLLKNRPPSVVWVMDSVTGLIDSKSDRLIEGFNEFLTLIHRFYKKKPSAVMVSDRDLFYTVLLHELYYGTPLWKTKTHEQQFVRQMAECFHISGERLNKIGNYIQLYRTLDTGRE